MELPSLGSTSRVTNSEVRVCCTARSPIISRPAPWHEGVGLGDTRLRGALRGRRRRAGQSTPHAEGRRSVGSRGVGCERAKRATRLEVLINLVGEVLEVDVGDDVTLEELERAEHRGPL